MLLLFAKGKGILMSQNKRKALQSRSYQPEIIIQALPVVANVEGWGSTPFSPSGVFHIFYAYTELGVFKDFG